MRLARSILRTWGAGLCWFFTTAVLLILLSHLPLGRVQLPPTTVAPIAFVEPTSPGEPYMHHPIDWLDSQFPHYTWKAAPYISAVRDYTDRLAHGKLVYVTAEFGGRPSEHPVMPVIEEAWGRSVFLIAVALPGGFVLGLLLGALGVPWRWLRLTAVSFAMGGLSVPDYYLVLFGQLATILCYRYLGFRLWSVGVPGGERQWVLPVLSLTVPVAAMVARLTTVTLDEIMRADYVRTARSMGIPDWRVILFHALRNALPRIFGALPILVNMTLSSLVVVELLTSWAGLGRYVMPGAQTQPALLATSALVFCACFTLLNAIAHTLRLLANPHLQEVRA